MRRMRAAQEIHGLESVSADPVEAGCVVCDAEDVVDGGGVRKRSVHCAAAAWTLSADHCRWSTGSPAMSSYHSPGPPDQHRPLKK